MRNAWFVAAVLFLLLCFAAICYLVVAAVEERQRHERLAVTTDEWVFEKYFEDRGNGVYHVEGKDWIQWQSSPFPDTKPEPDDPAKVRTTQDVATVLGEWQRRHNRRIVAFHLDSQDFTLILVTEPTRR